MEEQLIGNYKIVRQIGSGGMAKVYLAVHKDVPSLKVILKILSDPRMIERFRQEADKLALLDGHSNICQIKHFYARGEDTVIAMEYIEGVSLDDKCRSSERIPIAEAIRITAKVLETLSFAHSKKIFHRDIKPSNIMIDKSETVKIIDFGIARSESDPHLTAAGAACGTPHYMAPEQFTPTADTNYALVDVYAVGTTLYRMVTGELPFKGDNEFALRDAKLFSDPPTPRSLNSRIPKDLERIIMRSLDRDPNKRYASADEMRKALLALDLGRTDERVSGDDATVALDEMAPPPMSQPPKKSKKPVKIGILAVAVIIAAAVIYTQFISGPSSPSTSQPVDYEVTVDPYGDVYLDDSLVATGTSLAQFQSSPGEHVLRVVYPEDTTVYQAETLTVSARELVERSVGLDVSSVSSTGRLVIAITPKADVYLDDSLVARGESMADMSATAGNHVVRLTNNASREKTIIDTVRFEADGTVRRAYTFTIAPPPVRPDSGTLVVASRPRGADIFIDGVGYDQKTPFTFRVKTGRHVVRLELLYGESMQHFADTVEVGRNDEIRVFKDFEE